MKLRVATCGELKHQTFVHYGSSEFDKDKFRGIKGYATSEKVSGGYWCCKNSKGTKTEWKDFVNSGKALYGVDTKEEKDRDKRIIKSMKESLKQEKEELKELYKEKAKLNNKVYDDWAEEIADKYKLDKAIEQKKMEVKAARDYVKMTVRSKDDLEKRTKKLQDSMSNKHYIKIKPGARILKIKSEEEYIELIKQYVNEDALNEFVENERLSQFEPGLIDYKKLSSDYDGMMVDKKTLDKLSDDDIRKIHGLIE